jgi:trk system potassium uptake protein TrkH
MHYNVIFRILGILLMLFSLTMLVPLGVSLYFTDGAHSAFISSFLVTFIVGFIIWVPVYKASSDLRIRDGFLITSLFWVVLSTFGALPFLLDNHLAMPLSHALFESFSGLTTTGASVIVGLDNLPKSILYHRQQLQFMGGIGIVLIAVAILPMLGIGGMQLYKAETPGPIKDSKLTPRITQTAKWLFFIYTTLNVICAFSYWLAGMSIFDAIGHSFSTVAIGGFSTHDASMSYYQSPAIWLIASFFMFVSGFNFTLHFFTFSRGQLSQYFSDSESKFYTGYLLLAISLVSVCLYAYGVSDNLDYAVIHAIFQVVSISTTTGFSSTGYSSWPSFLPMFIFLLSFIGCSAGSTGGGIKVIRVILMAKQGLRELKQLIHPSAIIPIKLKRRPVPNSVLSAVWSFVAVYLLLVVIIVLSLQAAGMDFYTAVAATCATLNNMGGGLGDVASSYRDTTDAAKYIMIVAMLLGRLEIFTLLVLFTPAFWRK